MSVSNYLNQSHQRSFTLTTYDKVTTSSAQAKFTFSKANRFPIIKKTSDVGAYELPSALS